MLVPRTVRRAAHPVRTVKRAATPKSVKALGRATHPLDNAVYGAQRSLNTKPRKRAAPAARREPAPRTAKRAPVAVPSEKLPRWNYAQRKAIMDMRRAGRQGDASLVAAKHEELVRLRAERGPKA